MESTLIVESYLIKTQFGMQLTVKTDNGKWYQQQHQSLEYNGGGIAVWNEIDNPFAEYLNNNG